LRGWSIRTADHDAIIQEAVAELGARRTRKGYRPMSEREKQRLQRTTEQVLGWLSDFERGGTHLPSTTANAIRAASQRFYRDEWYQLDQQVEYLQVLRDVCYEASLADPPRLLSFFDALTGIVIEACRRTHRYEWPLLILVGYGALARTKLTEPLLAMLPHTPFDFWVVDRRPNSLEEARTAFREYPDVQILADQEVAGRLQEYTRSHPTTSVVVYVATDAASHLAVARHYSALRANVIAIEKPLCGPPGDRDGFRQLLEAHGASGSPAFVVVDHYAFKSAPLVVEEAKRKFPRFYNVAVDGANVMRFRMLERAGVDTSRQAAVEGVISDMLPHLFPFVTLFLTSQYERVEIEEARTWRYVGSPEDGGETCAQVLLHTPRGVRIEARVGKGLPETDKRVTLQGPDGSLELNLDNGQVLLSHGSFNGTIGSAGRGIGYGAVLSSLLIAPALEFQSIDTALRIADRLDAIQKAATPAGTYDFQKSNPAWLATDFLDAR